MQATLLILSLSALSGLANTALAAPPQPSVVPEGVAGPGPSVARRLPLSEAIPGERLSLGWSGGMLLASDGVGLWIVDPNTGAVSPARLPPAPGPKKRSKKAPPPPPLAPIATAVGPGGTAAMIALDTLWVFDPLTGALRWKAAAGGATRTQWSVDGAGVEIGGNNRHVVFSASSGTPLEAPDTRAPLYAYAALSQRMAVHVGGRVEIYDPSGVSPLAESAELSMLSLRADTRRLAGGGRGLWIWDVEARQQLLARDRQVEALAFSPDGTRLATLSEGDEPLEIYDAETGAPVAGLRTRERPRGLAWGADGTLYWVGEGALYRTTIRERDLRAELPGQATITALDAQSGWLAAGNAAGAVAVWGPDGALVTSDAASGPVERLQLDVEGKRLALRQSGDFLLRLDTGAREPCATAVPACAALDAAAEAGAVTEDENAPRVQPGALTTPVEGGLAEALGEQIRVWRAGELDELRWFGADGNWARWRDNQYTWGSMNPPLYERAGTEARVLPPPAQSVLMIDRGSVSLFDGGPAASLTMVVTNTGPGPAYSVRITPEHDGLVQIEGSAERARLGAGERLLVPLRVSSQPGRTGETTASLTVRSLYSPPDPVSLPVRVAPFPVRIDKSKVKKTKVKLHLESAGDPVLLQTQVWLAARGPGGAWTAIRAGEEGETRAWPYGESPSAPLIFDTMDLSASGGMDLEYRLPEKGPSRLQLMMLVPGGAPVTLAIPLD